MMQQLGQQMVMNLSSTNATAALVLSILGIMSFWFYRGGYLFRNPRPYTRKWIVANHKSIPKSP